MGYTTTYTVYHTRNGTISFEIDFWCREYYVDMVRKNSRAIGEYIRNQLKEDYTAESFRIKIGRVVYRKT